MYAFLRHPCEVEVKPLCDEASSHICQGFERLFEFEGGGLEDPKSINHTKTTIKNLKTSTTSTSTGTSPLATLRLRRTRILVPRGKCGYPHVLVIVGHAR
uniref:Uncharacterized protein n=1 Tax=Steinernema glaseri TaxID=37863 RepID=A0A1I7ZSK6_9BILA